MGPLCRLLLTLDHDSTRVLLQNLGVLRQHLWPSEPAIVEHHIHYQRSETLGGHLLPSRLEVRGNSAQFTLLFGWSRRRYRQARGFDWWCQRNWVQSFDLPRMGISKCIPYWVLFVPLPSTEATELGRKELTQSQTQLLDQGCHPGTHQIVSRAKKLCRGLSLPWVHSGSGLLPTDR